MRGAWVAGTVAAACAVAFLETRWREMQSALLVYFLATFWLALPRRVPAALTFVAFAVAPFVVHLLTGTPANWAPVATVTAVLLGTLAGALAGSAFDPLDLAPDEHDALRTPAHAIRARVLLALALSAFAALGLAPLWASFRWGTYAFGVLHLPAVEVTLVGVRWAQALTLVAWVMLTPVLLRVRTRIRLATDGGASGVTSAELARHVAVVTGLLALHALALSALGIAAAERTPIFFGQSPPLATLWLATLAAYAPLDLLTYIAILSLAHLSDRARQAREARRRAAALEATAVSARLEALRARLDPHFLYNALNAAVTLARRGQGDDTSRVLEELTALLRYVLDDTRTWVPLHEEMEFVRRYLEIMRLRFGSRLSYTVQGDVDVATVDVPLLVLQPLVENAVEHGVEGADGPVAVSVSARRGPGELSLVVEDDGPGPEASRRTGSGIGLSHTRERLAMLYGDAARLTLSARAPRGARTEVVLPLAPRPLP